MLSAFYHQQFIHLLCTILIANSSLQNITYTEEGYFQQKYSAYPALAYVRGLNLAERNAYETHFETLAHEFTSDHVIATCTFIQDSNGFSGLNVWKYVAYEIVWTLNGEDIKERLINDYLNYINDSEIRAKIGTFMESIGVQSDDVGLTIYIEQ